MLVVQSCPILCGPMNCSSPASTVHGILQARTGVDCHSLFQRIFPIQGLNLGLLHCWQILYHLSYREELACPSRFSCVRLFEILWTRACQAPLSTGFSRQEYWSGLPCPFPGDLPNPGMEPWSLLSPALAGGFFTTSATQGNPDIH